MEIKAKRIRSLDQYIGFVKRRTKLVIGLNRIERFRSILRDAGFTKNLEIGDSILPDASFGPVSRFNAEGRFQVHKNRPMETAFRMTEWHWREWRGRHDYEEMSKFVDVPYKRYPRTFIPPPSTELQVTATTKGQRLVVAAPIPFIKKNEALIQHTINLFLEIFGQCTVFYENLDEILKPPLRRLNWNVLPAGRWPWSRLQKELRPIIKEAAKGNRALIEDRFKTINGYEPEFVAIGKAGFRGYIVFAFPNKSAFVLESIYTDNATYVFDKKWERLSQMTKAQVLSNHLQKARFVHRAGWHAKIARLLR